MDLSSVKWLGHASFLIEDRKRMIYIDPYHLRGFDAPHADFVFITHGHYDHFSPEDIRRIADANTHVVAPKDVAQKLGQEYPKVEAVEPGDEYSVGGLEFDTIPAYNVKKDRLHYHPRENGWVGYIIDFDNMPLYHAGDTDFVEEMHGLKPNLGLVPMGGTYTMDVDEAVEASKAIDAKRIAPMHYKALLGEQKSKEAEALFKKNAKNGIILKEAIPPEAASR